MRIAAATLPPPFLSGGTATGRRASPAATAAEAARPHPADVPPTPPRVGGACRTRMPRRLVAGGGRRRPSRAPSTASVARAAGCLPVGARGRPPGGRAPHKKKKNTAGTQPRPIPEGGAGAHRRAPHGGPPRTQQGGSHGRGLPPQPPPASCVCRRRLVCRWVGRDTTAGTATSRRGCRHAAAAKTAPAATGRRRRAGSLAGDGVSSALPPTHALKKRNGHRSLVARRPVR